MLRPVIVLVEDDLDTRDFYCILLEREGYDVHSAESGEAALDVIRKVRPAAVVLDIGLPGMDGIEICSRIRQHAWFRNMPIIAVSGWVESGHRVDHLARASFTELLAKPVDVAMLIDTVRRWAPVATRAKVEEAKPPGAAGPAPIPYMGA